MPTTKHAILDELRKIETEIANHKREWYDALGTCFEREDWQRKQQRKSALKSALLAA